MPTYKLEIEVNGHDNASGTLKGVSNQLGALDVAMGNLVSGGVQALAGGMLSIARTGLTAATDYQSSLNMFQAVSGASAGEMAKVADMAKALGGDMTLPATSAGDAAKAMTELAKAGLSVENALAAGKGTLQLAAAGAIDEAKAAEIAANALNSFGLSGDKAAKVADLFAATANKSSVEVTDVADSFGMASAVFSAFQGPVVGAEQSMIDLTTAIGLLGNVGIKGSDAGTSLKQMLLQLTGPSSVAKEQMQGLMYAAMGATGGMENLSQVIQGNSKERSEALQAMAAANPGLQNMGDIAYDASGKMRPMPEIIDLVSKATKNMTDEQRNAALTSIFGADATRAIIGLMRAGPEAYADMQSAITQQGAAADLAGAQMKGLGGAWQGFQSTLETTALTLTEPLLAPLEQGVRAAADALAGATPALETFLNAHLVPLVVQLANGLPQALAWLSGTGLPALKQGWEALQPGIQAARELFVSAGDHLNDFGGIAKGAANFVLELGKQAQSLIAPISSAGQGFATMLAPHLAWLGAFVQDTILPGLTQFAAWLGPNLGGAIRVLSPLVIGLVDTGLSIVELALKAIAATWDTWLKPAFEAMSTWLADTTGGWDNLARGADALAKTLGAVAQAIRDIAAGKVDLTQIMSGWQNLTSGNIQIPGFATGVQNFSGGLAVVGEDGPELLHLPRGSSVTPAGQTSDLLSGVRLGSGSGSGGDITITVGQIVVQEAQNAQATAQTIRDELLRIGRNNNGNLFGGYA